jgi:hypothetical protein
MAGSLDLSTLNTTLGSYFRQNSTDVLKGVIAPLSIGKVATPYGNVKDQLVLPRLKMGKSIKPYSVTYAGGSGEIVPSARILQTRRFKVETELEPVSLHSTWEANLIAGSADKPFDTSLEAFLAADIQENVIHQLELAAIYKGIYDGTGTDPEDGINGLLKDITDCITSGEIPAGNVYAGAAITNSNALDQAKEVYKNIPARVRTAGGLALGCSQKFFDLYCEDYAATRGANPYNTQYDQVYLEGSKVPLVVLDGMEGSNRFFICPKKALAFGYDLGAENISFDTQHDKWKIIVLGTFNFGVCIADGRYFYCNNFTNIDAGLTYSL